MATKQKSIAFKNAVIDVEDRTITEYCKDETNVYDLDEVLQDWNKVEGVSLTIKITEDAPSSED